MRILFITAVYLSTMIGLNYAESGTNASVPGYAEYRKALQYYGEKKFLLAIGNFKKAKDEGFDDAKLHFYLGNSLVQNEDYDKASEEFRVAVEMANAADFQGIILHNLGYTYYLKKDYPKSVEMWNKAFEINSNLSQTFWFKGMSYYRLRDKTNTIAEWESYLAKVTNGPQSDNIRKALEILKSADFTFEKNKIPAELGLSGTHESGTVSGQSDGSAGKKETKPPVVEPLVDIEGVLNEIKPSDKGKVSDESMEDIEK